MPIFEMPDGNRYEINSEEELKELEAMFAQQPQERSAFTDMKEGALASGAAIADLAVGIPKTLGGLIGSAAVAPFVEGGVKEAKEKVFGGIEEFAGPSIGQAYELTENPAYKAIMYPFEKMGEGFEWFGEKTSPEMQLAAEVGSLFVPIPAGRAIKKGLEKVTPHRDVTLMREELGYKNISPEELAALRRNEAPKNIPAPTKTAEQKAAEYIEKRENIGGPEAYISYEKTVSSLEKQLKRKLTDAEKATVYQDMLPKPLDVKKEIAAKEQPAMGPVERSMPTEEMGLTPGRTEQVVAAQGRRNQEIIDREIFNEGIFIKGRDAINARTRETPRTAQENIAWQQHKDSMFQRPVDTELRKVQENAAWADRAGAVAEPGQAAVQRPMGGVGSRGFNQGGAIDISTATQLFSDLYKAVASGNTKQAFRLIDVSDKQQAVRFVEAAKERLAIVAEGKIAGETSSGRKGFVDEQYKQREKVINDLSKMVNKLPDNFKLGGVGKQGFKQGGAIIPPGRPRTVKPPLEDFVKRAVDNGFSRDAAVKSYRELYGEPKGTVKRGLSIGDYKKITSPEEAISIAKASADLNKPVDSATFLNQGRMAAQRTLNRGYTALVEYAETMREQVSIGVQRTLTNGKDGFAELYRNMLSKNITDLKEVMTAIKENQFNPDYVPNFKSEKQQQLFNSYKKWADGLHNLVNTELVKQGRKPLHKLPNWFPSLWVGDFAFPIYAKTEKGQKLVFLVKESTRGGAETALKHMKKDLGEGYIIGNVEYTPMLHKKQIERSMGLGNAMEDFIRLLGEEDPLTMKAKASWEAATDKMAFDTAQYKQRFKYKVGVRGYLGDKSWKTDKQNLQDMYLAIERTSKSATEWAANQRMQEFNKQVQAEAIPANVKRSFQNYTDDLLQNYSAIQLGTKMTEKIIDTMSQWPIAKHYVGDKTTLKNYLRSFAAWETVRLLGTNMRMIVQSEVQPSMVLLPKMVELVSGGGSKDIISPLIIGHLQGTKMYAATKSKAMEKFLTPDEVKMLDYIKKHEVADLLLVERDQFKSKIWNDIYKAASFTLKEAEAHSRFEAFNVMTNYFKQSGYDIDTAMGMADNVSRELMGNYAEHVRAGIIRDTGFLGEIAGRLQSFKVFQLSQLAHYINAAKATGNVLPLASMLSIQASLGGVIGIIGMDLAETVNDMVRAATGDAELPTIKERVIKATNNTVAFGALSTMTDQGLYGAFQFNTVGDMGWKNFMPIVGAQWDTINSILDSGKVLKNTAMDRLSSDADIYDALKGIAPGAANKYLENKFLRDDLTGSLHSSKTGKTSYTPEDSRETEPNLLKDMLWNIPSLDRAKSKTINYMSGQEETRLYEKRKALMSDIIELRFDLDDDPGNTYLMNNYDAKVDKYLELSGNRGMQELRRELTKAREMRKYGTAAERSQRSKDYGRRERGAEWLDVQER